MWSLIAGILLKEIAAMAANAVNFNRGNEPQKSADEGIKPVSKWWLNIGYEYTNPETGEVTFVGPVGIPMDNAKPDLKGLRSSNPEYVKLVEAKNEALADLMALFESMNQNGDSKILSGLKVEAKVRRPEAAPSAAGTNAIAAAKPKFF